MFWRRITIHNKGGEEMKKYVKPELKQIKLPASLTNE